MPNDVCSSLLRPRRHQTHAAFALGQTKAALNLYTFTLILMRLLSIHNSVLLRPSECRTGKSNVVQFAVCQIVTSAVYFVRKDPLGIMLYALVEELCDLL